MSANDLIGICSRCGDSLTNGHVCPKWMFVDNNKYLEKPSRNILLKDLDVVLIFNRVISEDERYIVDWYMAEKFVKDLPDYHPYKNKKPSEEVLKKLLEEGMPIKKIAGEYMEKKIMLHYLRNPYGADELEFRKARLQAANELERLYKFEEEFKNYVKSLDIQIRDIEALKSSSEDSLKGFLKIKK